MGADNNRNLILGGAVHHSAELTGLLAVVVFCLLTTVCLFMRRAKVRQMKLWLNMTDLSFPHSGLDDPDEMDRESSESSRGHSIDSVSRNGI